MLAVIETAPIEQLIDAQAAKARRKVGSMFHRLELRLRARVVVRDVRSAVALGDIQIDQQAGHRLGAHGRTSIGVQGRSGGLDVMPRHDVGNQLLSQLGALARGAQPAHDEAAEDVQDHVQVEARPFGQPLELGDVPGPDLVGCGGEQLGLGVGRVGELVAPLAAAPCVCIGRQQSVHGSHRAEVGALVEQRGVHVR